MHLKVSTLGLQEQVAGLIATDLEYEGRIQSLEAIIGGIFFLIYIAKTPFTLLGVHTHRQTESSNFGLTD